MSYPPCHDPRLMKTELTEIAFILDRSGSMKSLEEQAISGAISASRKVSALRSTPSQK